MKKLTLSIIFVIFFSGAFAQNHRVYIRTEAKYLYLITQQHNRNLVENDLWNGQLIADSILFRYLSDPYADDELAFLSLAYYEARQWAMAYLTGIEYFIFYPDSIHKRMVRSVMINSAYKLKVAPQQMECLWDTLFSRKFTRQQAFLYVLKQNIYLRTRKTDLYFIHFVNMMQYNNYFIPYWLRQWKLYAELGINPRHRVKMINFDKANERITSFEDYFKYLNDRQKLEVRVKALRGFKF